MWSDWRPEVVAADLRQLADEGLAVLRVFPLWSDFQPVAALRAGKGRIRDFRAGEQSLGHDEAGRAGVDARMIARFGELADQAAQCGLKLIVALINGWMSGRLFVPPALDGLNILTDPMARMWQVRFVRYFVRHFKGHPAIAAWDLGNECNCLGQVDKAEEAWEWSSAIADAIGAEDAVRPIVSGMHSLAPDRKGPWRIQDQGELTDVLTTHPYPLFTPWCDADPMNTIRPCLQATAESRFYGDISGKPCLAEEMGTLGPMICSEKVAADYVRAALFSLWAHDCRGMLWWCAYDQGHLAHAPYDWNAIERELGLIRADRSPKPTIKEVGRFAQFLKTLPVPALPPRTSEAVCILTENQDSWGAAYAAFVLARQAGFDITFQYADADLKDSQLYLLPSVCGDTGLWRRMWGQLREKVQAGASLYLSHNDCILSLFAEVFGLEVQTRSRRNGPARFTMGEAAGQTAFSLPAAIRLDLATAGAEVLAREDDGNACLACHAYGKGKAYFLSAPMESELSRTPGAFHAAGAQPFWKIYARMAQAALAKRVLRRDNPLVGVTEHPLDDRKRIAVLVNYSPELAEVTLGLSEGWKAGASWYGPRLGWKGSACQTSLPANDAAVLMLVR
jgi:hypothetical protein